MKYNKVELADCLVDAKEILQNLLYAQTKDAEFPIEDNFKDIAKAKSIITKAELLINPKPNKEQSQQLNKCDVMRSLPQDWYAVYSGSEKLDLGDKSPIAFVKFEAHAKELIKKYHSFGYYEKLGGNDA